MDRANRAALELAIYWQSEQATHCDRRFVSKSSFWRDIFPSGMDDVVGNMQSGERYALDFPAGELIPAHEVRRVVKFASRLFEREQRNMIIEPVLGRFYPQGFAWSALNCYKGNFQPFRVVGMDGKNITADPNHPLVRYPLKLEMRYVEKLPAIEEHGGICNDMAELATEKGPGMQIPYPGVQTDFYSTYPFICMDAREDALFYSAPRLIQHLDAAAIHEVTALYARLLKTGDRVLDLMSSWVSHLPEALEDLHVTGLGMNQEELDANPRLKASLVHDLNRNPHLPFADDSFDAVICTVSVEYLTQPLEVMRELARVTRAGGSVVMTFSDRWFPTKVIELWPEIHPFERQGLVLDYFLQAGAYTSLHTESVREWPRPEDDPHSHETPFSDPVFAVWGEVRK